MLKERERQGLPDFIEIRAIKIDKHKELFKSLTFTKDPKTGIFYGISMGEFPDGNVKWQRIMMGEVNNYNLFNIYEAKQWCVLRMHSSIKGSPLQLEDPVFEMLDPEIESRKVLNRSAQIRRALDVAEKMKPEELIKFARYLALAVPATPTLNQMRAMISVHAQTFPVEFLNHYDDKTRGIGEVVKMGLSLGIVQNELEKGFQFGGIFMGHSEPEIVRYLEEDTVLLSRIQKEITLRDNETKALVDEAEKSAPKKEPPKKPAKPADGKKQ